MPRWTSYLAILAAAIALGVAVSPTVDASPTLEPGVKPKLTTPVVVKANLDGIKPAEIAKKSAQAVPLKVKATPSKRLQEIVAQRSKDAIIARGIGARTVVSPRQMYLDKRTFMLAYGEVSVDPQRGTTGSITMRRRSEWIDYWGMTDFVAVRFRAAPDKHYVVDCLVRGDDVELHLARGNDWIGGAGTHDGDHRIAHLPKASTRRDVVAYLFNETDAKVWGDVYQCEIIPLHE